MYVRGPANWGHTCLNSWTTPGSAQGTTCGIDIELGSDMTSTILQYYLSSPAEIYFPSNSQNHLFLLVLRLCIIHYLSYPENSIFISSQINFTYLFWLCSAPLVTFWTSFALQVFLSYFKFTPAQCLKSTLAVVL